MRRSVKLLKMTCNLCLDIIQDKGNLIDIASPEGHELKIGQIIQKHLWININPTSRQSYCVCRNCWQILFAFNELYNKVKEARNCSRDVRCGSSDSDEPLSSLRKDVELSESTVKEEPTPFDLPTNEDKMKILENASMRRSARLVKQQNEASVPCTNDAPAVQRTVPFEYKFITDGEIIIKNESPTIDTNINDSIAFNNVTDHSLDSPIEVNDEGSTNDFSEICTPNQKENILTKRSRSLKIKRRGRPNKSSKLSQIKRSQLKRTPIKRNPIGQASSISAENQLSKSQVSKEYDDFLSKNYKLMCCLCQAPLTDFMALKAHFRAQHNTRGYVQCCSKKFLKRGVLVDHIRTHMDPDYFKCAKCNKVAANRRCLELHMQLHEQTRDRVFQCEICTKSYFRKSVFMRHLLLHVPEEDKKIKCPQCEKVFVTDYVMKQHLKLVHLNVYAKICDICGKSIRGREAFQRHQLEHAGVPKPLVQCDLCGMKLTNKYGLSRHIKVRHSEENLCPQVCNICSKVSATISAHRRHMNYVHKMERKHACPMCVKAFKRAKDLREHMTTHTGETLYTCPHCPKTFNSNANMHSHRKKVHRKEWEENRKQRFVPFNESQAQSCDDIKLEGNADDAKAAGVYTANNGEFHDIASD